MRVRTDIQYFTPDGRLTQAGWAVFTAIADQSEAAATKIAAAAAVPDAIGGGTMDAQARAQLAAIKVALT